MGRYKNLSKVPSGLEVEKITNRDVYGNLSLSELHDQFGEELCENCPLPESAKGVHCYGGAPVMCEGSHCSEAVDIWFDEQVDEESEEVK